MGNAVAVKLAAAAVVVVVAGYWVACFWRFLASQWFLRVLWKFLTGWHPDNRPGRHKRAARRGGGVLALMGLLFGLFINAQVTGWVILCLLFVSFGLGCWWCWHTLRRLRHRRTWLRPAHLAAHQVAHIDPRRHPHEWLKVAPDRSSAVAALPAGWGGDDKERQRLVSILTAKLGMPEALPSWHLAGPKPTLELTVERPPPREVSLAQLMPFIEAAKPDAVVCGLGIESAPVGIDLDGDSPHIGITMGSGGGKSVTSRLILAQMLYKGCIGIVLDAPKRISHTWARGLPNVAYCREVEEVHDMLLWLKAECDQRNRVADAAADIEGRIRANVGPRIIVIAEELNTLMKRLRAYWLRERVSGDPVRSPALDALDEVLSMGRQVLMNVVMIGQRLSDKATGGGGDARENLAALIFARFKPSTWKMLASDMPMPARTTHKLRAWTVTDSVRAVQVALVTGREARDLALAGTVDVLASRYPDIPGVTGSVHQAISAPGLGFVTQQPGISPIAAVPVTGLVTVRQAIDEGILPEGTTPQAVKQARYRDRLRPEGERVFPEQRGTRRLAPLYDATELEDWGAGRR